MEAKVVSDLLIDLLTYFETVEIEFVLKKSNFKPSFFGTLQSQFANNWSISVVDDNGEFSVMASLDGESVYFSYKKDEVAEVANQIIRVMNYEA